MNHEICLSPGMTLKCSPDGIILTVLHNDLELADPSIVGKPFPVILDPTSVQKGLAFLVELRHRKSAFDWEFDLPLKNSQILVHCVGVYLDGYLLIMVARTRTVVNHLLEEMMRINNEQVNLSRRVTKERTELARPQLEVDIGLYEQLSRVNNEMSTLHRELAKKNAELERLHADVQRLSIIDELTHIYNRRGFFEVADREFERARRYGKPLAAVMLDIDHFKKFNDNYGHAIGDQVLEEVATRCAMELRKVDVFGRYGGEEFVLLLSETDRESAVEIAERVRIRIRSTPFMSSVGPLDVTMSLGVAMMNVECRGLAQLLEIADRALFKAKESGRNRVCGEAA